MASQKPTKEQRNAEHLRKVNEIRTARGRKPLTKINPWPGRLLISSVVLLIFLVIIINVGSSEESAAQQAVPPATQPVDQADAAPPPATQPTIPQDEQDFVNIMGTAAQAYNASANDMTKGAERHKREAAICNRFSGMHMSRWAGTIQTLDATDKGNGILAISLNSNVTIGTNNNELSDSLGTPTLIPVNSALFQKVSQMKVGDSVYFTGDFISDPQGIDCFQETSLTTDGSMQNPNFLFRFTDVSEISGN